MADIRPDPEDVKFGESFGANGTEVGEFIGEISVEVNTGKIIIPISDEKSIVV